MRKKVSEDIVGQEENTGQHFLHFPLCISPFQISTSAQCLFYGMPILSNWTSLKFC